MLTIWFTNGTTAHFNEVSNFKKDEDRLSCIYYGQDFQVWRELVINTSSIAAYAYNSTE